MAQLVPFPELVQNLLFLHGAAVELALQTGHFTLAVEQGVVAGPAETVGLIAPELQSQLFL